MFSQWLGEEDELYKFISAPCPQEPETLSALSGQNEVYNFTSAPCPQEQEALSEQCELYNFISSPCPQEQEALSEQCELYNFISSPCPQEQTTLVQQNPISWNFNVNPSLSHVLDHGSTSTSKPRTSRRRKFNAAMDDVEKNPKDYLKKIIHRDFERQRRQQMSSLYLHLRSVIPPEHLQGKRSISNHIHRAIKYIMYMKKKIEGLHNRRDELVMKKPDASSSESVNDRPIITVKTCKEAGRMEITASIGMNGHSSLSKIMQVLHSEGLFAKNCTSTRVHQRMLHIIQLEVHEVRIIDSNELYKKLMGTANMN